MPYIFSKTNGVREMKRFQNFLTIVTVGLIGISIVSFGISALGAAIGSETIPGLFGYLATYSGLGMLITGAIMSVIFFFKMAQDCLHHSSSAVTH